MEFNTIPDCSSVMVLSCYSLFKVRCWLNLTLFSLFSLVHLCLYYLRNYQFSLHVCICMQVSSPLFNHNNISGSCIYEGFFTLKKVCLSLRDEVRSNDHHSIMGEGIFLRNAISLSFKKEIKRVQYICFNAQVRSSVLTWILFPWISFFLLKEETEGLCSIRKEFWFFFFKWNKKAFYSGALTLLSAKIYFNKFSSSLWGVRFGSHIFS